MDLDSFTTKLLTNDDFSRKKFFEEDDSQMVEQLKKNLRDRSFSEEDARIVSNILKQDKQLAFQIISFVSTSEESESPIKSAIWTFGSFAFFGFVPLLTYVISPFVCALSGYTIGTTSINLFVSSCLALFTLWMLGKMKAKLSQVTHSRKSSLQTLLVGGIAAVMAYSIAWGMSPHA